MAQPHAKPHDGPQIHRMLFKSDRPREIDRYIDYFGGTTDTAASADDPFGEALLDRLA